MKIIAVGPLYPYTGGIPQHLGSTCAALAKEHEVSGVSFSMLYPKLLYKPTQRDPANTAFRFEPVQFMLNSVNPVTWYRTARYINREKPDLVILPWWHPWFGPCFSTLLRRLDREIIKVIVCHNVLPHDGFPMKNVLTRAVLKRGDAFIVHSTQEQENLKKFVRDPLYSYVTLPAFTQFKKRNLGREEARRELGIPEGQEMVLFFGYIREYKGLKHLIRALPKICAARPKAHLYIVGDFFENNKEDYLRLIRETGTEPLLTLADGYLPDDRVEPYFAAADLCVLPYESATQSGITQVSECFCVPAVVTDVGGLPETVADGETGFVVPPRDPDALADAVVRFFAEGRAAAFSENIRRKNELNSWDRMTDAVDRMAEKIREGRA